MTEFKDLKTRKEELKEVIWELEELSKVTDKKEVIKILGIIPFPIVTSIPNHDIIDEA